MRRNKSLTKYLLQMLLTAVVCTCMLLSLPASAQLRTYFIFATAQKKINGVCGEGELFSANEKMLNVSDIYTAESDAKKVVQSKYPPSAYENYNVKVVANNMVAICYKGTRVFKLDVDQWDCTNTFYGCITALNFSQADAEYNTLKSNNPNITYSEEKRWPLK